MDMKNPRLREGELPDANCESRDGAWGRGGILSAVLGLFAGSTNLHFGPRCQNERSCL
jgi:hypothetical protein